MSSPDQLGVHGAAAGGDWLKHELRGSLYSSGGRLQVKISTSILSGLHMCWSNYLLVISLRYAAWANFIIWFQSSSMFIIIKHQGWSVRSDCVMLHVVYIEQLIIIPIVMQPTRRNI